MEPKRDEIIKALECCTSIGGCKKCPYSINGKPKDNGDCGQEMLIDALSLLKEFTEENERLRNRVVCKVVIPNEKLEEIKTECLSRVEIDIKAIQADTVRKMQEKLRDQSEFNWYADEDRALYYVDLQVWADQIVREMLEGEG